LHEVGQTLAAHFGRVFDCEMGELIYD
jgi:hypothetical protein